MKRNLTLILSIDQVNMLSRIHKESKKFQVRSRAQFVILYSRGYSMTELSTIFRVHHNTVTNWLNSWLSNGLTGLYNKSGGGRPPILNDQEKERVKKQVKKHPQKASLVLDWIDKELGKILSKETLKRVLKSMGMSWHRARRVLFNKPEEQEYNKKKAELEMLQDLERKGYFVIYYMDESGFSLTPYIPYCWQEKGEKVLLPSRRSKQLNVMGFLSKNNDLSAYSHQGSINSQIAITFIDEFVRSITEPVVIVLDNAPIHHSKAFSEKIAEWQQNQAGIFFLPRYSPHLNPIEILWKKIKYEWLGFDAYASWENLVEDVENIIKNVGTQFTIDFS